MSSSVRWIESTSWELDFYGLPHRFPWPEEADQEAANAHPLNLETLLEAIDRLQPPVEPWSGFRAATGLFEELSEALGEGEIVRTERLLEEIERLHPGSAFTRFQHANLARLAGDDAQASKFLESALEKAPNAAPLWSALGNARLQAGDRDGGIAALKKALEIDSNEQGALNSLTQLRQLVKLVRQKEDGQADPNSVAYVDLDTFRGMISGQIEALAEEPEQLVALADQLMRDGMLLDVVISALEKALEVRPDQERALMLLASAYRAAERHSDALALVKRFTELLPDEATGFMHLAQAFNTLRDSDKEREALGRVLELDPNFHAAIGIYFELAQNEHDPAKEEKIAAWASSHGSWMGLLIASSIARTRGDTAAALRHADGAYAIAPEREEVLLHLTAVLGEGKELGRLSSQIRSAVESGRYSARLDWNFAQTLYQHGFRDEASGVLRRALAAEGAPEEFKSMASSTLESWAGVLTGCGVPIQAKLGGHVLAPILITLPDGDGGVVIGAGRSLPAEGVFPWRGIQEGVAEVILQQGESGSQKSPQSLGTFRAGNVDMAEGAPPVECHVSVSTDAELMFRAAQGGRRLPVAWRAPL
jgi:tetratricopeptide (TPR) repeat protein